MTDIVETLADGGDESENEDEEDRRKDSHDCECRGKYCVGFFSFFVGKAKESCLHAKGEDN